MKGLCRATNGTVASVDNFGIFKDLCTRMVISTTDGSYVHTIHINALKTYAHMYVCLAKVNSAQFENLSKPLCAGLPDGMFSNQKSEFRKILEGLGIEKLYSIVHSIVIWNLLLPFGTLLWLFGNFVAIWYILPRLLY
jgi:hypothetical protein